MPHSLTGLNHAKLNSVEVNILIAGRKMSQQSDMADAIHQRLSAGPVSVASLVRELRARWGHEHGVSAVHGFIAEVSRCTIGRDGVQLGALIDGRFVPWQGELCDVDDRFEEEMKSADAFIEDENRYVFAKEENSFRFEVRQK